MEDKEFHPSRTLATEFMFMPTNCSWLLLVYQENSSRIGHNFPLNPMENQDLDDWIILSSHIGTFYSQVMVRVTQATLKNFPGIKFQVIGMALFLQMDSVFFYG